MPEKDTMQRARKDLREGKSASTAAGEFVHPPFSAVSNPGNRSEVPGELFVCMAGAVKGIFQP